MGEKTKNTLSSRDSVSKIPVNILCVGRVFPNENVTQTNNNLVLCVY